MSHTALLSFDLPVTPRRVYQAFLHAKDHSAMIGSPSHISAKAGSAWDAWDGYCQGKVVLLKTDELIALTWKAADWVPRRGQRGDRSIGRLPGGLPGDDHALRDSRRPGQGAGKGLEGLLRKADDPFFLQGSGPELGSTEKSRKDQRRPKNGSTSDGEDPSPKNQDAGEKTGEEKTLKT